MKKILYLIACILVQSICFGQSNDLPNRDSLDLKIAVDSINFYQTTIGSTPYILMNHTVQLYPGEQVFVEMEFDGSELKTAKTVKENLNPEKTVIISFKQLMEGKIHQGMMLHITNPFDKELDYQAHMFLMKSSKWLPTSILPIQAKLSSYEHWSDVIVSIGLSGWQLN